MTRLRRIGGYCLKPLGSCPQTEMRPCSMNWLKLRANYGKIIVDAKFYLFLCLYTFNFSLYLVILRKTS
jgi:hypothetical protein